MGLYTSRFRKKETPQTLPQTMTSPRSILDLEKDTYVGVPKTNINLNQIRSPELQQGLQETGQIMEARQQSRNNPYGVEMPQQVGTPVSEIKPAKSWDEMTGGEKFGAVTNEADKFGKSMAGAAGLGGTSMILKGVGLFGRLTEKVTGLEYVLDKAGVEKTPTQQLLDFTQKIDQYRAKEFGDTYDIELMKKMNPSDLPGYILMHPDFIVNSMTSMVQSGLLWKTGGMAALTGIEGGGLLAERRAINLARGDEEKIGDILYSSAMGLFNAWIESKTFKIMTGGQKIPISDVLINKISNNIAKNVVNWGTKVLAEMGEEFIQEGLPILVAEAVFRDRNDLAAALKEAMEQGKIASIMAIPGAGVMSAMGVSQQNKTQNIQSKYRNLNAAQDMARFLSEAKVFYGDKAIENGKVNQTLVNSRANDLARKANEFFKDIISKKAVSTPTQEGLIEKALKSKEYTTTDEFFNTAMDEIAKYLPKKEGTDFKNAVEMAIEDTYLTEKGTQILPESKESAKAKGKESVYRGEEGEHQLRVQATQADDAVLGEGLYVFDEAHKQEAQNFAKNGGKLEEFFVDESKAKVLEIKNQEEYDALVKESMKKHPELTKSGDLIRQYALDNGYDILDGSKMEDNQIGKMIINPNSEFITKSSVVQGLKESSKEEINKSKLATKITGVVRIKNIPKEQPAKQENVIPKEDLRFIYKEIFSQNVQEELQKAVAKKLREEEIQKLNDNQKLVLQNALRSIAAADNITEGVIIENIQNLGGEVTTETEATKPTLPETPAGTTIEATQKAVEQVPEAEIKPITNETFEKATESLTDRLSQETKEKANALEDDILNYLKTDSETFVDVKRDKNKRTAFNLSVRKFPEGKYGYGAAIFTPKYSQAVNYKPKFSTVQKAKKMAIQRGIRMVEAARQAGMPVTNLENLRIALQKANGKLGKAGLTLKKVKKIAKETKAKYKLKYPERKTKLKPSELKNLGVILTKQKLLKIMKLSPDFKDGSVLTMKDGFLKFEGKSHSFSVKPEVLGLTDLEDGDTIVVREEDLKSKNAGQLPVVEKTETPKPPLQEGGKPPIYYNSKNNAGDMLKMEVVKDSPEKNEIIVKIAGKENTSEFKLNREYFLKDKPEVASKLSQTQETVPTKNIDIEEKTIDEIKGKSSLWNNLISVKDKNVDVVTVNWLEDPYYIIKKGFSSFDDAISETSGIRSYKFKNTVIASYHTKNELISALKKLPDYKPSQSQEATPDTGTDIVIDKYIKTYYKVENGQYVIREEDNDYILAKANTLKKAIIEAKRAIELPAKEIKARSEQYAEGKTPKGAYGNVGSMAISEFETLPIKQIEKPSERFNLADKTLSLIRKYAERVGEGYLPKRFKGLFKPREKMIRLKGLTSISTAVHEIAHFLDISKVHLSDKIIKELKRNDTLRVQFKDVYMKFYPGARKFHSLNKKITEGFAVFMQKYAETPSFMEAAYPELVEAILYEDGRLYNPLFQEIITDIREIVRDYQALSPLEMTAARLTYDETREVGDTIMTKFQKARTQINDFIFPVEVITKERSGKWFTKKDMSLWLRAQMRTVRSILANNIEGANIGEKGYHRLIEGNMKATLPFTWDDFMKKVYAPYEAGYFKSKKLEITEEQRKINQQKNEENGRDWDAFLIDRRKYFEYQRLDKLKETVENHPAEDEMMSMSREEIKEIEDEKKELKELTEIIKNDEISRKEAEEGYLAGKDRFVEEMKMFDTLKKEDILFASDPMVQLIPLEQAEKFLTDDGAYASMKRAFYDEVLGDKESNYKGAGMIIGNNKISSLFRRKGSSREIISPTISAIRNHAEITRKGFAQIPYNMVVDYAQEMPELFEILELESYVDKSGVVHYPQEKDPNIIMARKDYKKVPVLVNKQIKEVIDDVMTPQNAGHIMGFLTFQARVFTRGTTAIFQQFGAITNPLLDQFTLWSLSRFNAKPFWSTAKFVREMIKDKDGKAANYYKEWLMWGGQQYTLSRSSDETAADVIKELEEETSLTKTFLNKWSKGGMKFMDALAYVASKSENLTRGWEYVQSRLSGEDQVVAFERAARITGSFHHVGKLGGKEGRQLIRTMPFTNANIQVLAQTVNALQENPKTRKRLLTVMGVMMAAQASAFGALLAFGSDEDKRKYIGMNPEELSKYIYYPKPGGGLGRIRVPEQLTTLGTVFNMIIADAFLKANYSMKDYYVGATSFMPNILNFPLIFFKGGLRDYGLSLVPHFAKTMALTSLNLKDYPTVSPLVGQKLARLEQKEQYTDSTSLLAIKLGRLVNFSPIKIDAFMTGLFGRSIGYLTIKPSAYNWASPFFFREYFYSTRQVQKYFDIKEENDPKYNTYNKLLKEGKSTKGYEDVIKMNEKLKTVSSVLDEFNDVDEEKEPIRAEALRKKAFYLINKL